jgi:hypothetical protein
MSSTKSIDTINWPALSADRNAIELTTELPPVPDTRIILEEGKYYNIYDEEEKKFDIKGVKYTGSAPKNFVFFFEKLVFDEKLQKDVLLEYILCPSPRYSAEEVNQE